MRIGIYDPYLDTMGGGERYILTAAEVLSEKHTVEIFLGTHLKKINKTELKNKLSKHLDLDLSKAVFVDAPIGAGSNILYRLLFLRNYDLVISLTDGSVFYSTAKKNILHIQSPISNPKLKNIWNRFKLNSWNLVIYNSEFTKINARKNWPVKSEVIYPPVNISDIKPLKKQKKILTVGRFFSFLREKKHEVMIRAFIDLYNKYKFKDWIFELVGTAGVGDLGYIDELKKLAKDYPIYFYPNLAYPELIKKYGGSSIYWHAMGYEEDDPTKMEHFGITTVEAMAGGCVPVVINKGGQKEIVEDGINGFLWDDLLGLEKKTVILINDDKLFDKLSLGATEKSKKYSKENFNYKFLEIVEG